MSSVKERLLGAITVMDEEQAWQLWECVMDMNRTPNEETLEAMREVDEMRKHPERYKSYHSFDEMVKDILKEDE